MPQRITTAAGLLFWPVAVAGRVGRGPLWAAWLVHAAGLAMGVGVFAAWLEMWLRAESSWQYREFVDDAFTLNGALVAVSVFVGIEVAVAVAAASLAAWGAGDEPVRASVLAALKRLWATGPHAAVVAGASLAVFIAVDGRSNYGLGYYDAEEALNALGVVAASWYLAAVALACLAAGRSSPRCVWPPRCEACGYAMVGFAADTPCPECGRPAGESVDAARRPGLWGREAGAWRPWWWCFSHAIGTGRRVRPFDERARVARAMAWSSAGTVAATVAFVFVMNRVQDWRYGGRFDATREAFDAVTAAAVGGGLALVSLWVMIGTASLSGWLAERGTRRNLMPATLQVAARMSPAVAASFAAYFVYVIGLTLADPDGLVLAVSSALGVSDAMVIAVLIFGPHGLFVLLWTAQMAKAARAARFANA